MAMTYLDFGHALLNTKDLDPIYVMLVEANLPEPVLKRWLLAYWCFYSAGVAAKIAESRCFFQTMLQANRENWPHGRERRHFRGSAADKAIRYMIDFGSPEQVVDHMTAGNDFATVAAHAQEFPMFGPWISWKIADMAESVMQRVVDFSGAELGIYRDPVQGAALVKFGDKHYPITLEELHEVVNQLTNDFSDCLAPPRYDRIINIQEVETILCKYKAHVYWRYYAGMDIDEVAEGLHGWGDLAQELSLHLPAKVVSYARGAV